MLSGIGPTELVIVLVLALIVLGPKRLPEAGRSLGKGFREFKQSITGRDDADEDLQFVPVPARAESPSGP